MVEDKFGGVTFVSRDISPEHVTAAEQKLMEFYTPELVTLVNEIYGDDFRKFNYTMWDGKGAPVLN